MVLRQSSHDRKHAHLEFHHVKIIHCNHGQKCADRVKCCNKTKGLCEIMVVSLSESTSHHTSVVAVYLALSVVFDLESLFAAK